MVISAVRDRDGVRGMARVKLGFGNMNYRILGGSTRVRGSERDRREGHSVGTLGAR